MPPVVLEFGGNLLPGIPITTNGSAALPPDNLWDVVVQRESLSDNILSMGILYQLSIKSVESLEYEHAITGKFVICPERDSVNPHQWEIQAALSGICTLIYFGSQVMETRAKYVSQILPGSKVIYLPSLSAVGWPLARLPTTRPQINSAKLFEVLQSAVKMLPIGFTICTRSTAPEHYATFACILNSCAQPTNSRGGTLLLTSIVETSLSLTATFVLTKE